MERIKTRQATELHKLIPGILLAGGGIVYAFVIQRPSMKLGAVAFLFGVVLLVLSRLGHACVACSRVMKSKEYGFAPSVAEPLRKAARADDIEAIADIVRGPKIHNRTPDRTAMVVGYCDRCKKVATIEAIKMEGGAHAGSIADKELAGDHVTPLVEAAIDTAP